jgi:hypothetical protein
MFVMSLVLSMSAIAQEYQPDQKRRTNVYVFTVPKTEPAAPEKKSEMLELRTQFIDAGTKGSNNEIWLPAGHQLVFRPIGRWNPNGGGTLGSSKSSLGAAGVNVLRWKKSHTISSYLKNENIDGWLTYKKGDNIPGGAFTAPEHPFFCLLFRLEGQSKWRAFPTSESFGRLVNGDESPRRCEFKMNDQEGEFSNNDSGLHLIYAILPHKNIPWEIGGGSFLPDEHLKRLGKPIHLSGDPDIKCEWLLRNYDKDAGKYYYTAWFWHDTFDTIKAKVTFKDNEGNLVSGDLHLPPTKVISFGSFGLVGMTVEQISASEVKRLGSATNP